MSQILEAGGHEGPGYHQTDAGAPVSHALTGPERTAGRDSRRLRILFVVRPGTLLRFASLVQHLGERGHELHIAFTRKPVERALDLAEGVAARFPGVTYGRAPRRADRDGWRYVAWLVRGLADLARYAHPRYERAPVLRERMAGRILGMLKKRDFEPLGRALGLRLARRLETAVDPELSERVIRAAARMEEAIPSSVAIERYLRERTPDVVVVTSPMRPASEEVEYLKSARRLGIPNGVCVASWDNLTNKGLLKFVADRVFVWNEAQIREATELHGIPAERVRATGAGIFDEWFERGPSRTAAEFAQVVGLAHARPYVVYLCSSPLIAGKGEVEFVTAWIEALRASGDERVRGLGILVRPHPNYAGMWRRAELARFGNAVVWPAAGAHPVAEDARADFFDTLFHSAAVVGINTTAMIEAAIVGKSVLTVLRPEFAQESTLHFHHLLVENGGFLHVAASLDEHVAELQAALDGADPETRLRFVEQFVRPHGLDRPATPVMAEAIEELAALEVAPARPGALPLRLLLGIEAALSSLYAARRGGGFRRRRPAGRPRVEPGTAPRDAASPGR